MTFLRKLQDREVVCALGRASRRGWLRVLLLTFALAALACAQQAPAPETPAEQPAHSEEHRITKAEAQDLFRSVDEILQFASERTGLPVLHPVKKKLATREEVAKYVEKRLRQQGSGERFDRTALPLKKLGLLPRDFDLRAYMLGLYKEQVEGWYDPHNKTVYLLDWVAPELQKPVMAHELVHALQDQSFGLEDWLNVGKESKDDNVQIALDEQRIARQSVVEGQAMLVLFAYELAASGQSLEAAPAAVDSMRASVLSEENATPMYAHAPIYLREALLFPYGYGVDFVRAVLAQRGKQAAFAAVFQHPPTDTRQIMQPAVYLAANSQNLPKDATPNAASPKDAQPSHTPPQTRIEPLPRIPPQPRINVVPLDAVLGANWRRQDVAGLGEIDLRILLRVWGGEAATQFAPAWRGGYYFALANKRAPRDAPLSLALVFQFDSAVAAHVFAALYQAALPKRYNSVERLHLEPAAFPPAQRQWNTNEGLISLYQDGATVIALESLNAADAAKAHQALLEGLAAR